jgi:hypothetical protein
MWTCPQCGAVVPPSEVACKYCGTLSREGVRQHRQDHVRAEAEAAVRVAEIDHAKKLAEDAADGAARQALSWAIWSLFLCFTALPALVAFFMALRAHRTARAGGVPSPGRATAALVLSVVSLAAFATMIGLYVSESQKLATRRASLEKVAARATAAAIDQPTACALVELSLIDTGFEGRHWLVGDSVACSGKLEQTGERATLHDVNLQRSGTSVARITGCLDHGARWMVARALREGAPCVPPLPTPPKKAPAKPR